MKTKECIVCKHLFDAPTASKKTCSPECLIQWGKIKSKRNYAKKRDSIRKDSICKQCKKEFNYAYRKERGEREFCGRSCASKFYIDNGTFDSWRLRKNPKEGSNVPCDECSSLIYVTQFYMKSEALHFCNRRCKGQYFSKKFSGRGNPMYGKKLSEESLAKQKQTLLENHGVKNAFALSDRKTKTKKQIELHEFLSRNFPNLQIEIEKRIICDPDEVFADIVSFSHKFVIEFYGDYWHCHPQKYDKNFLHPHKQKVAAKIWEEDIDRLYKIQKNGFNTFVVWEDDYLRSKQEVLESLVRWINNDQKENSCTLRPSVDLADVKSGELLETSNAVCTTT